jgi:DNA-binding NarL/FixJ family response regulator
MTDTPKIRVMCVDDHPVVRDGVAALVNLQPDMTLVASAATAQDAIDQFRRARPDITLMDLELPDMTGFDAIRVIKAQSADARIIVLSSYSGDVDIRQAIDAGARGYVSKGMVRDELLRVIRAVHAGQRAIPAALSAKLAEPVADEQLNPREIEVLRLISAGRSNDDIAAALSLTDTAMQRHVHGILSKLGVDDRTEAVTVARRRGIIPP